MQQATAALNASDYARLQKLCKQILDSDRNQADAWFFMSIVAEAGRQPVHALQFVDRALQIDPVHSEYLTQKAKLHSLLNHYAAALEAARSALKAGPDRAIVLDTLGVVLTRLGVYDEARDLLQRAVDMEPANPQYQFNLGSAEQFLGHDDAARRAYEQSIILKPDFCRAYWALSELEKTGNESGRLDNMLKLAASTSNSLDQLYLAHAISREHEKQGDFDKAFEILDTSKQRRRTELNYSVDQDLQLFETIRNAFTETQPEASGTDALDGRALFIIGMPRTGTTLLERILSSHSKVISLGELQEFPRAVKQLAGTRSPVVLDEETLSAALDADMGALGEAYAGMLSDRARPDKFFIDKLPLNFYCVGFIMAALPRAKVICLRRNPMDTILSNYRQLFALNFSYYNYHYDLADTARFFVEFDRLMSFWQSRFGDRFYQLDYETLVESPEQSTREILEYLGLEWEPACLEFHTHQGGVATASASQVRQPLYNTSIARWKKYEKHLSPAMEVLDQAGIRYK